MKKLLTLSLAALMVLALAACGGAPAQSPAASSGAPEVVAPAPDAGTQTGSEPAGVKPAVDGTLTVGAGDLAVVVNETPVQMPYPLGQLAAAGVTVDESLTVGAGQYFAVNLYLDEAEDYVLIPYYYNDGAEDISITKAGAEEIAMTTYADEPKDQGVSIFGVTFGMARSQVKALLGEPSQDDGDYAEWHVEVPGIEYEGTLSMYFTEDADTGAVSQVDLTVFAK